MEKEPQQSGYGWVIAAVAIPVTLAGVYFWTRGSKKGGRGGEGGEGVEGGVDAFTIRSSSFHKSESFFEEQKDSPSATTAWVSLGLEQPLVIAMVGLPARGKSYIVKMTIRYLKWIGFECKVFNVGAYRRKHGMAAADSNFFDGNNMEAQQIREDMAVAVQDEMYQWLRQGAGHSQRVAVFDATNTTIKRRQGLALRSRSENAFLLFVESICDDQEVLTRNYDLKLQNEDYKGMTLEAARADFLERVHAYEKVYETIEDYEDSNQICYIKLINVGQKVITRNCHGYLPSQVAFYLQNVHIHPRKIYLSITSEGVRELQKGGGMLGGLGSVGSVGSMASVGSAGSGLEGMGRGLGNKSPSSDRLTGREGKLTPAGASYSSALADYIRYEQQTDLVEAGKEIMVLTGTVGIHYDTVSALRDMNFRVIHTNLLNELRGGDFEGLTKDQIRDMYPEEYEKRVADKLNYRYPGVAGESYLDVIERVRPVIIELERQKRSIVLVCHMAVLRCIYAYFMGVALPDIPVKPFQKHHIYELSPGPFGCTCAVIDPLDQRTTQD